MLKNVILSREDAADKEIITRVEKVAQKHGVSMATVATAWALKKGVAPIVGLGSKERIDEAVRSLGFVDRLAEEDVKVLEEPYVPKVIVGH
jgi:aryl-alcohol dehydrogenase-like predicted oxidoreductase